MIELIFDKDCFKILSLFSISPGSGFRRNQIKDKTLLNNVPLDKALTRLVRANVLRNDKNIYRINFESEYSKKVLDIISKQHKEMKELPLNVYFLITDLVDGLSVMNRQRIEVYLFGSYSKLIYREKSDVDIAILGPEDLDMDAISRISKKIENKYEKHIEIHDFVKGEFYKNKRDPLVKDILTNGIRLI
jgi:predicted nucleotidyltransferase